MGSFIFCPQTIECVCQPAETRHGCMAYHIAVPAKRKTTLLLDATLWRRFQEEVLRTAGPRAVSAEVEKRLAAEDPEEFLRALEGVFSAPGGGFPSLAEVERTRPRIRRKAGDLIREERDERDDRVLGLQRDRETGPRRGRHTRRR